MALLLVAGFAQPDNASSKEGPLKVFILAGQSNMQGHGHLRTADWLGQDPEHGRMLEMIKNADGSYVVRDDVWIYYKRNENETKHGPLTVGYGARDEKIGPEIAFGHTVADRYDEQVLLIKTAWGGKSCAIDFRSPSAGAPPLETYPERQRAKIEQQIADGKLGFYYRQMIAEVKHVLANLETLFPDYDGRGYELTGLAWFQGFNDKINTAFVAEYTHNLANIIKDLRVDLGAKDLPVYIGEMGIQGLKADEKMITFRDAQAAVAEWPGLKNVHFVRTAQHWDEEAQAILDAGYKRNKWTDDALKARFEAMGSQPPYHYLGSVKIYSLVGYELGRAAVSNP
ncbi:MAG: sialate O-acetylesterase [Planctomycetota bacterium]|jgi:alpha-galactosidase